MSFFRCFLRPGRPGHSHWFHHASRSRQGCGAKSYSSAGSGSRTPGTWRVERRVVHRIQSPPQDPGVYAARTSGGSETSFHQVQQKLAKATGKCITILLRGYKLLISPLLPSACRFHPTCSEYMRQAVEIHGPAQGVWLGLKRLGRCHPFHEGGADPVPR